MSKDKQTPPPPPSGFRGPGARGPMMRVVEKPKNFKGGLTRLLKYLKPYRILLICMVLCILLETFFHSLSPKLLGDITTTIFEGIQQKTGIDYAKIVNILITLGMSYFLNIAFLYLQQVVMAHISQNMMKALRREIDLKIARLPLKYTFKGTMV